MPDEGSPLDKVVTLPGGEALARELPGWTVLPLDGAERPAFAVLHPASGVALIDAAPGAAEALRRRLEVAGFAGRFGALPPIARIAMGPEDAGLAGERVAAAFTELPPLAFAPDAAWVRAAREVLTDPSFLAVAAPQAAVEPGAGSAAAPVGRGGGRRLLGVFWGAVGSLVLAGGLLLQLAGPPSAQTEPEAKPGADAPAVPLARVVPRPVDEVVAPPPDAPAATEAPPPVPPVTEASTPAPAVAEVKDDGRVTVADAAPEAPRERGSAATEVAAPPPAVAEAAQREAEAAHPPTAAADPARAGAPAMVATGSVTPPAPAAEASPSPVDAAKEQSEPALVEAPTKSQQEAGPAPLAPPTGEHAAAGEAHEAVSPLAAAADTVSGAPEPASATPAATAGDAVAAPADVATPPSPSSETTAEAPPAPAAPEAPAAAPDEPASAAAPGDAPPPAAAHEAAAADTEPTVTEPAPAVGSPEEAPGKTDAPAGAAPATAPPQVIASAPPAAAPVADPPRPPVVAVPDTPLVTAMIRRGHEMLANGDVSGARLLFRRAASVGSGEGALALARALDPAALARMGVVGIRGDAAEAAYWYRIAAERGHADARREDAAPRGE